ncbi:hypothetical protein HK104_001691 [Borealophlyctis nickersoniae]|nr:hypothetical protein HK104_001691 [Borealophlyctis nickersoniae]
MPVLVGDLAVSLFAIVWEQYMAKRMNQQMVVHVFVRKATPQEETESCLPSITPTFRRVPALPYDILLLLVSHYASYKEALALRCGDRSLYKLIGRQDLITAFKRTAARRVWYTENKAILCGLAFITDAMGEISTQGATDLVSMLMETTFTPAWIYQYNIRPRDYISSPELKHLVAAAAHRGYSAVIDQLIKSGLRFKGLPETVFFLDGTHLAFSFEVDWNYCRTESPRQDWYRSDRQFWVTVPCNPTSDFTDAVALLLNGTFHGDAYAAAFVRSCKLGHTRIVKMLLDNRIKQSISQRDQFFEKALEKGMRHAVNRSDTELVRILLSDHEWTNAQLTCFSWMAASTREIFELFVGEALVRKCGDKHHQLEWAAWHMSFDYVKLLVEGGADPTYALMAAITSTETSATTADRRADMVRYLISAGADLSGRMATNAIRAAASRKDFKMVQLLIDAGVNVCAEDNALLCWAVEHARKDIAKDIVKYLIEAGCDVHARRDFPLRWAAEKERADIMVALFAAGANISATNSDIEYKSHNRYTQFLIEAGTTIHTNPSHALCTAASLGLLPLVQYFLTTKADIHTDTDAPLRLAAQNGHYTTVRALIAAGADVNADNSYALRAAVCGDPNISPEWINAQLHSLHPPRTLRPIIRTCASDQDRSAIVLHLISQGADAAADDSYALRIASAVASRAVVEALVACKGVDVHAVNDQALKVAVVRKLCGVVDVLAPVPLKQIYICANLYLCHGRRTHKTARCGMGTVTEGGSYDYTKYGRDVKVGGAVASRAVVGALVACKGVDVHAVNSQAVAVAWGRGNGMSWE